MVISKYRVRLIKEWSKELTLNYGKGYDVSNLKRMGQLYLILQKEEVECVKWLTVEEIKELISKEEFRKGNIKAFENIIKSDKYTK